MRPNLNMDKSIFFATLYLSLLHDVLDLLVLRLQILVGLGQVGEPPLVLVVPADSMLIFVDICSLD